MDFMYESNVYSLTFPVQADLHAIEFVRRWADALFREFAQISDEPFMLRIGGFRPVLANYDCIAEMCTISDETRRKNLDIFQRLVNLRGKQHCFGRNHKDPGENYAGRVDISVIMAERPDLPGVLHQPQPLASALLRLAYSHYYEQSQKLYGAWSTDYFDSPQITDLRFGPGVTYRELWRDFLQTPPISPD